MSGETDLARLLATLDPVLDPRRFVFASFPEMSLAEADRFAPVGVFREAEGLTVIAEDTALMQHITSGTPRFAMISLRVHSSLEAVGLTAVLSQALTEAGISANIVAAAFHDHVFVPAARADEAVTVLRGLAAPPAP